MSTLVVFILVVGFIAGGLLLLRDTANKPGPRSSQDGYTSNPTPDTYSSTQYDSYGSRCNSEESSGDSGNSCDDGGGDSDSSDGGSDSSSGD